jgi:hypothetical protein
VQYQDLLQTLSEVAATFAGFTGVISVFGRSGETGSTWTLHGARSIIEASLATILFALLPFVIDGFGAEGDATWRIASGLFLAVVLAGAVGGTRRIRNVAGQTGTPPFSGSPPLFLVITSVIGTGICVLLAANVFGFSFGTPATVYLVCLIGPLAVAGLTFLQMVVRATRS